MTGRAPASSVTPTFELPIDASETELREAFKRNGIVRSVGVFRKERFVWGPPGEEWPVGSLSLETSHVSVAGLVAINGRRKGAGLSSRVGAGDVVTAYALQDQADDARIPPWSRERGAPYFVEVCHYRVLVAGRSA